MRLLSPIQVAILACSLGQAAYSGDITGTIVLQDFSGRDVATPAIYDLRASTPQPSASVPKRRRFDHVAVWLENNRRPESVVPAQAEMKQIERQFQPDFLVIPVGSTVEFPNGDPIFHNIFSLSHAEPFDLGYYSQGKTRKVTFNRPGVVQVYCHIHSDMYGVIVVAPTTWSAIPDSTGSFSFNNLPPGDYRLMVWQKKAGLVRKKVSVSKDASVHLRMVLPDESDD